MERGTHANPPGGMEIVLQGDERIAQQAAMVAALSEGSSQLRRVPESRAFRVTLDALRRLGVAWAEPEPRRLVIGGCGGRLVCPSAPIDCADSLATAWLLMGLLAAQPFATTLVGRGRVDVPGFRNLMEGLGRLGAEVRLGEAPGGWSVTVVGAALTGRRLVVETAEEVVKASFLLAGVLARGVTTVTDGLRASADHLERLLRAGGIEVRGAADAVAVEGGRAPRPLDLEIPGDVSAAACWLVLAACHRGSRLRLRHVCLNRRRLGFLTVLLRMGACLREEVVHCGDSEWHGILDIRGAERRPVGIDLARAPMLRESLPVLGVAAAMASGRTTIDGVAAWRGEEPHRFARVLSLWRSFGVAVDEYDDRVIIHGTGALHASDFHPGSDSWLAMTWAVASVLSRAPFRDRPEETTAAVDPDFWRVMDGGFDGLVGRG